jgi:hypothetical protein
MVVLNQMNVADQPLCNGPFHLSFLYLVMAVFDERVVVKLSYLMLATATLLPVPSQAKWKPHYASAHRKFRTGTSPGN